MPQISCSTFRDKNFEAAGKPTINVFKLLGHSSATVENWTTIGHAHFTKVDLTKKQRELVILLSSSKFGSTYEWTHHIPLSAKFGITDAQRSELELAGKQKGHFTYPSAVAKKVGFDEKEQVLLAFLEAVIEQGVVGETFWPVVKQHFSERQIVEIISMQGFYYTLSRVTTVLDCEMGEEVKKPKL